MLKGLVLIAAAPVVFFWVLSGGAKQALLAITLLVLTGVIAGVLLPRVRLWRKRALRSEVVRRIHRSTSTRLKQQQGQYPPHHTQHFLDLDEDFVNEINNNSHTHNNVVRIMSLTAYLDSLVYDKNDQELGYLLVSAMSKALGLGPRLVPFLFPPHYLPRDQTVLATSGELVKFTLEKFPSILVLAAMVDGATSLFANKQQKSEAAESMSEEVAPGMDAADVFALGEVPTARPPMMPLGDGTTSIITLSRDLSLPALVVAARVDLGPEPDVLHYCCPRPLSPLLAPGLCRGPGGLRKSCTPRQDYTSRALAAILNKLGANYMGLAGYGPSSASSSSSSKPYGQFAARMGDETKRIQTCGEFVRELVRVGGGTLECRIRSNLTAFGYDVCVLDDDDNGDAEEEEEMEFGDSVTKDQRHRYTVIPLAFRTRTGIVSPVFSSSSSTGKEADEDATTKDIHQLSTHSAVEWLFRDNALLGGDGCCCCVTFYAGVEGFTGFKPGGEWVRPWVTSSERITRVEDASLAADFAAVIGVSSNVCVREAKFPFGGYGGLGVCADSVAWLEICLTGRTGIFPLVMRADAKTWLLRVMHEHVLGKLEKLQEEEVVVRPFLSLVRQAAQALVQLPNDIQVEPQDMEATLDRLALSISPRSPFMGDKFECARMDQVKAGWRDVLEHLGLWKGPSDAPLGVGFS